MKNYLRGFSKENNFRNTAIEHAHVTAVGHFLGHSHDTVLSLLVTRILLLSVSQGSSVSIATRLWNWSSIPSRCSNFSVHCVCASSWAHPTSSLMDTECCFASSVKLTIQLHLVPKLGMCRTLLPLPHTS
jgi:hypothetical protein